MKVFAPLFIFVTLFCALSPSWAASTPAQYDYALAQVQHALQTQIPSLKVGEVSPTAPAPALVADTLLRPILSVQAPDSIGTRPVNTTLLRQSIKDAERIHSLSDRARAYQALFNQIAHLRRELPVSGSTGQESKSPVAAARTVLSGDDYQSDPLPPPSLSEKIAQWIHDHIHFPHYTGPSLSISPIFIRVLLYLILAVVFAVLVAVLVQAINRQRAGRATPLSLDESETALVEARDTDSLRALAEQSARQGDHRRAFRLIYLATLVFLDTDGVLRFDRSKTNWEYLRALRATGRDDLYQSLTPLTREFDRVWYGFARAGAAEYARALSYYDGLHPASTAVGGAR